METEIRHITYSLLFDIIKTRLLVFGKISLFILAFSATNSRSNAQLAITGGGTGATTAPIALSHLGAAASGANSDITSITLPGQPLFINSGTTANSASLEIQGNFNGLFHPSSTILGFWMGSNISAGGGDADFINGYFGGPGPSFAWYQADSAMNTTKLMYHY